MRAVSLDRSGLPEALRVDIVPDPVPGPGQVVATTAVGVNTSDVLRRQGRCVVTGQALWTLGHGAGRRPPVVLERPLAAQLGDAGRPRTPWPGHHVPVTPPRVRLVLFDLDGTLVDHEGAAATAVQRWLLGAGWASEDAIPALVTRWEDVAEHHFPAYRARRTTFQGQRRLRLREFLPDVGVDPASWSDDRLDEVFAAYDTAYTEAWRAFDDALPCLQALRGLVATAVLSNGDQRQQQAKVDRTGLGRQITAVLTSDGLGVAKPDAGAFTAACAHLGVPPREALYVGDRLDVDAVAAAAAGLRGVWLDRSGTGGAPQVTAIPTLADLPPLVGALR